MLISRKFRIGINALFQARGGSLTNVTQLIEEWCNMGLFQEHQFIFFCSLHTANHLKVKIPHNSKIIVMKLADRGLIWRVITEQIILPFIIRKLNLDVLFCPANTMPLASSVPTVTTFQNAAPFCDTVKPSSIGCSNYFRQLILRCFMRLAAIRSQKIIFISHFFMNLFLKRFNIPKEKCVVIYRARDNV